MASEWDQFEDAPADFSGFQDAPTELTSTDFHSVGADFRIDKFRKLFSEPGNEVAIKAFAKNELGLPESEWGKYSEAYANKDGKTAFGLLLQDIQRADLGTQSAQGAMAETATGLFPLTAEAYQRYGTGSPMYPLAALGDAALYATSFGAGQAVRGAPLLAGAPVKQALLGTLAEGAVAGGGTQAGKVALGGDASLGQALATMGGVAAGNVAGSAVGGLRKMISDIPVTPQVYRKELSDAAIRSKLGGEGTQFLETAVKDQPATGSAVGPALMEAQGQAYNIGQEIVAKANEFDDQLFKEVAGKLEGKSIDVSGAIKALESAKFTGENLLTSQKNANKIIDEYIANLGGSPTQGSTVVGPRNLGQSFEIDPITLERRAIADQTEGASKTVSGGGYDRGALSLTGTERKPILSGVEAWNKRKMLDSNINWDTQGIDSGTGARVQKALKEARRAIAGEMEKEAGTGPDMKAWRTRIEAQDDLKDHLGNSLESQEKRAEGFVRNLYGKNKTQAQKDLEKFDNVFGTDYAKRSLAAASAEKLGVFPVLGVKSTEFPSEVTRMDTDPADLASLSTLANPANLLRMVGGRTKNEVSPAYNVARMRDLATKQQYWATSPKLTSGVQTLSSLLTGLATVPPWLTRQAGGALYPTPTGEQ